MAKTGVTAKLPKVNMKEYRVTENAAFKCISRDTPLDQINSAFHEFKKLYIRMKKRETTNKEE